MNNEQATENFKNYIKDKKVIFVGPARNLMDKNLGSFIDSYDVVVRTNGSKILAKSLWQDYGKKTNVCYFNVQHLREEHPFPINPMKKHGVQHIVFKTIGNDMRKHYEQYFNVRDVSKLIRILHKSVEGLLMGPILLTDLISFQPKELFVTGIDCYVTKPKVFIPGDYREYYPNYLGDKIEIKANTANIGRVDPHTLKPDNALYIKRLIDQGRVKTHDFVIDSINKFLSRF